MGDDAISGTADGADAVVERAQLIASYGLDFDLLHLLVSRENMALSLHNTARREDAVLDEYLATVCRLRDGKNREYRDLPLRRARDERLLRLTPSKVLTAWAMPCVTSTRATTMTERAAFPPPPDLFPSRRCQD
ncbi:hypothetical protein [Streptomyces smyrnaeus]|uniref:hypothetical protein n=1 Tax=Streptomyces smyrnaeus TaxID=1387713 RepID=UPI003F4CC639